MKIYTKAGDDGETSLCSGEKVRKNDPRVRACGAVDELNCVLGECLALNKDEEIGGMLVQIQRDLFVIGSHLAEAKIDEEFDTEVLEEAIDLMEEELPELKDFILPGGFPLAAKIHTARAVCRRAEREVCNLATTSEISQYLNRLSDLLFVLARYTNMKCGNADLKWH
ncbi:MAG: cob(I)yrinic acid a,c-diamide adenosyltransferase [Patescibacteria group bacterium]|nr:cob(I)yrinic acid a,c-diamide adenosyltransferase [Patescibacteria group bacterium]